MRPTGDPTEPTAPIEDLVLRAQRGDREAFSGLYERVGHAVFVFLGGLLRRRDDAEDALQAAFLHAWTGIPGLRRPERFVPWIFRIARNAARDSGRSRARWPDAIPDGDDLVGPAPPQDGDDDADVRRLVADLKPETRALVLLRAVEGWSAEDVAAALRMSVSTVRRKYARALEHLRERLESPETRESHERIERIG